MLLFGRWWKKYVRLAIWITGIVVAGFFMLSYILEGSSGLVRGDNSIFARAIRPKLTESCPIDPPDLAGRLPCNCSQIFPNDLKVYDNIIEKGGRVRPKDCISLQRTAIIIPFRDRYWHLYTLLYNLIPFFKRQQADVTFFIIEQISPKIFNRATLFNIGFLESLKLDKNFDCFIFHDVDLVPLDDNLLYRCESNPRHFPVAIKKYGNRDPRPIYGVYFGGAVAFSREQFLKTNGHSNLYFGWGGEDDDLQARVLHQKYRRLKEDEKVAVYEMLRHERNDRKRGNVDRMLMLRTATQRMFDEGLNTTIYTVNRIREEKFFTWIETSINMSQILLNAPDYTRRAIKSMLEQIPKDTLQGTTQATTTEGFADVVMNFDKYMR